MEATDPYKVYNNNSQGGGHHVIPPSLSCSVIFCCTTPFCFMSHTHNTESDLFAPMPLLSCPFREGKLKFDLIIISSCELFVHCSPARSRDP